MRRASALLRADVAVCLFLTLALPAGQAMAQAKPPIKFGVVAAVSGEAASYSKPFLDAIQMIAEDFNKEGGIMGRPVQVVFYDDRGIPDAALQAAKKLVFDDKVHTLQPGSTSGAIFTAMPVGKDGKVAMWGYGLAKQWLVEGEGMIWRSAAPDQVMIGALARFAHEQQKLRNVGILHIDTFYGETSRDIFKQEFEALGGKVVKVVTYADGSRDFSSQLLTLAKEKLDSVFLVVQGGAMAPALRQVRQFIPRAWTVLADNNLYNPKVREESADLANGIYYYTHPMIIQNPDPLVQQWIGKLRQRLGTFHEIMARAIIGMTVMKAAIEKAGTTDAIPVMKQVHRMKNFPTPMGNFTYDPRDGEGLKSGVVLQVKAGGDMSKDQVIQTITVTRELYDKRIDYTKFFGPGYREELYAFHGVK